MNRFLPNEDRKIFTIGSGKGGVGKSFITANIGALLARQGKQVLLVDLDLGGANLHTYIGQKTLARGMKDFLNKTCPHLADTIQPTHVNNLFFIHSVGCTIEIANLYAAQKAKILRAIKALPHDVILVDIGAGTHFNTLDFFLAGDQQLLTLTCEPAAIENAFRLLKAAYFRMVKQTLKRHLFQSVTHHLDISDATADQSFKIIRHVKQLDPAMGEHLENALSRFRFHIVMNQVKKGDDAGLGQVIETVCRRHFLSEFNFAGNVRYEDKVHDAAVHRQLFVEKYAYTPSATDLSDIADAIIQPEWPARDTAKLS